VNNKKAKLLRKIVRLSKQDLSSVPTYDKKKYVKLFKEQKTTMQVYTASLKTDCQRFFYKAIKTAYKLSSRTTKKFNLSQVL